MMQERWRAVIRRILASIVALGFYALSGCASTSYEVMEIGLKCNVKEPLPWPATVAAAPEVAYQSFMDLLEASGARIVAKDETAGFVAWDHVPKYFSLLQSYASDQPGIVSAAVNPGIVHGTARVEPAGEGSALYIRSVLRDKYDSSVYPSNGDYERLLLRALNNKLAQGS